MLSLVGAQDGTTTQTIVVPEIKKFRHVDIVDETFFRETLYYDMVSAFFEGMTWNSKYENSETCLTSFSLLMDDFYFMNINHTEALTQEERFFNVTGVIANNYAETFY